MAKLPLLSSTEVVTAFQRWGWQVVKRRGKGSHIILVKEGHILPHYLSPVIDKLQEEH